MKCVYKPKIKIKLFLNNGKCIDSMGRYIDGRFCYKYGEKPKDEVEEYTNDCWDKLLNLIGYKNFSGYKTLFRKRLYINNYFVADERIYKDELVKLIIERTYEEIENPNIKYLQEDLGFKGYSELVFDKEQELKKLMEN